MVCDINERIYEVSCIYSSKSGETEKHCQINNNEALKNLIKPSLQKQKIGKEEIDKTA